ncbi:uncharacterized protein APUU_51322A [Aspergillus puulaauensis]|uniref:N-acetyltransferase domain-containing protein n=1 Tax=Aspergillus puulaauensis TaxID=1220207 RepID=A0A7R7XRY7_9EURO|nr:uncharacterized protein APUU_51322A [Aspergillus puulaauensis]BCS26611.1 hypothetical protein APUU_51322A [Aspergillus puulaauensis]
MHAHHHPYTTLLTHLKAHLPQSGPLLRRIQHQATHPSPTAQVLASFPPGSEPETKTGTETPWLAAYADVHRGLDTQVWVFSTLETKSNSNSASASASEPTHHNNHNNAPISTQEKETTKYQLLSLFTHIRTKLVPPYIAWVSSQPPALVAHLNPEKARDEGVKKIPPHPKTSVLLGSVHKTVVELICELASETLPTKPSANPSPSPGPESSRPGVRIHRGQNVFYAKYCFPSSSFNDDINSDGPEKGSLVGKGSGPGPGYTFTDSTGVSGIQEKHLDLVKNRTNIPRSKQALMAMGGVALYYRPGGDGDVYDDGDGLPASSPPVATASGAGVGAGADGEGEGEMPIGWAFLGFDGSLCTLHVEPEHRGKGLGGVVGKEVMKRGVDVFEPSARHNHGGLGGGQEEWFFADVAVDNVASRRVMEKMGGEIGWYVAWMVVEADI